MTFLLKMNCLLKFRSWKSIRPLFGECKNYFSVSCTSYLMPGIRSRSLKGKTYMEKDKIPHDYQIIYRAPMELYLSASKSITTFTTVVIGGLALLKYTIGTRLSDGTDVKHITEAFFGLISDDSDLVFFAVGFLLITIALRVILSKYPLRIYRNQEKYIAIFQGQMPFSKSRKEFIKGEVAESSSIALNPWRDSMYKMKDSNVILLIDYFKTPSELEEMLSK